MNGHEAAALYAAAFTPQHKELLRPLPEASEEFAALLVELAQDPMPDRIAACDSKGEVSRFLGICDICATPGPLVSIHPAPQSGCPAAAIQVVLASQVSLYGPPAALLRGEPPSV